MKQEIDINRLPDLRAVYAEDMISETVSEMSGSEHNIYAIEGLDGTGKTTVAKLLASETGGIYYCWKDSNWTRHIKGIFERTPSITRFFYYVLTASETHLRAEKLRTKSHVFLDRSMLATIVYHRAMGVPESWTNLIPSFAINQITRVIYFTSDDQTRYQRMTNRATEGYEPDYNDHKSLDLSEELDRMYRSIAPEKTIVIDTTSKSPSQIVTEVRGIINV